MTAPAAALRRAAAALPAHGRLPRFAVHCATLLVLALPALVAGAQLAAPPAALELERLQQALLPESAAGARSEVAATFLRAAVGDAPWPAEPVAQLELLGHARVAQVLGLLGLTLCMHLAVLLARGRLQALLTCACLAALPPIGQDGHVLRPETPAALAAMFAVLLLQCVAQAPRDGRLLWAASHWSRTAALALCAMVANGLAVAALPSGGEVLLVPGIVLTLAAMQTAVRGHRVLRRRSFLRVPLPAINGRLLPWTAMALASPAVAWWVLSRATLGATEAQSATFGMHGLWPQSWWACTLVAALAGAGAIVATARVGVQFGRRGRLGPDLVLFVACAVALAAGCADPVGQDGLPAAVAMAFLCGEGVRAAIVLWLGRVRVTAPARS